MGEMTRALSGYVQRTKKFDALREILFATWRRDTARPEWQMAWTEATPWVGQDDATALLVLLQTHGGFLHICSIPGFGDHWYNRLPAGEGCLDIDYVGDNYRMPRPIVRGYPSRFRQLAIDQVDNRLRAEGMLDELPDLKRRYDLLVSRVSDHLDRALTELHEAARLSS